MRAQGTNGASRGASIDELVSPVGVNGAIAVLLRKLGYKDSAVLVEGMERSVLKEWESYHRFPQDTHQTPEYFLRLRVDNYELRWLLHALFELGLESITKASAKTWAELGKIARIAEDAAAVRRMLGLCRTDISCLTDAYYRSRFRAPYRRTHLA